MEDILTCRSKEHQVQILLHFCISDHTGKPLTEEQKKENQTAERITWLGFASNVLMSLGKAFVGVVGNSTAMIADAAHNLGDLIADVVTLVSLKLGRKPIDSNHPHGHGRFEV
jgi:divalent metal cation (Fe/Co/Zn/Cd) transporter